MLLEGVEERQIERTEFTQPYAQGMPLGKNIAFAFKKTTIQSLLHGGKKKVTLNFI